MTSTIGVPTDSIDFRDKALEEVSSRGIPHLLERDVSKSGDFFGNVFDPRRAV
jgi:hypothetical protein